MSDDESEEVVYYQRQKKPPAPKPTKQNAENPERTVYRTEEKVKPKKTKEKVIEMDKEQFEEVHTVSKAEYKRLMKEKNKDKPKKERTEAQKQAFAKMLQMKKHKLIKQQMEKEELRNQESKRKVKIKVVSKPKPKKKVETKKRIHAIQNDYSESEEEYTEETPTEDVTTDAETVRYRKQAKKRIQTVRHIDKQLDELRHKPQQQQGFDYSQIFPNW